MISFTVSVMHNFAIQKFNIWNPFIYTKRLCRNFNPNKVFDWSEYDNESFRLYFQFEWQMTNHNISISWKVQMSIGLDHRWKILKHSSIPFFFPAINQEQSNQEYDVIVPYDTSEKYDTRHAFQNYELHDVKKNILFKKIELQYNLTS